MNRARLVFLGSPDFAVPSLRALAEAGYDVQLVVTQPDRPAGRGARPQAPAVKRVATELGLPTLQPETLRDDAVCERLAALSPDAFVIAAYGKILPRRVLEIPRRGSLNVHASLLPRWRGPSPVAAAILAGDREAGVTIMEVTEKMDAGPIVAQRRIPIDPSDRTKTLEPRLAVVGAELLLEALPPWLAGDLRGVPQDEARATYCPLLKKEHGHLAPELAVEVAERAVRAYDPWPGAFVWYRGERLAVWAAHIGPPLERLPPPGTILVVGRAPALAFANGILVLDVVQRPGGRRLTGGEFLNGERGQLAPTFE